MKTPYKVKGRVAWATTAAVLLALMSVAPVQARPVEPDPAAVVHVAPGAELVDDSYLVALHDAALTGGRAAGAPAVAALASALVGRHGGVVGHVYSSALRGFAVRMSAAQAARLADDPAVARVEQDTMVSVAGTQTNAPWNLDRVDQRVLPLSTTFTYPSTASNVNVYVIDTGIRITHQDFGGRARHGRDTVDEDNDASDCHGHGTHMAGTAAGATYGAAKGVTVHAVRVLPCSGSDPKSDVIEGIDWVTANAVKPAVANMSLRGSASDIEDTAVRNSIASGVVYVAGAGNDSGDACTYSPGRMPEVITVGNSTNTDARASSSNFGTCLDLFAPGTNITSAWHTSDTATNTVSGTSMATPLVSGAVALYLAANPSATGAQVHQALVGCATVGVITSPGTGSPNRLLFIPCGTVTDPGVYENPTDIPIPDWSTAHSPITVTGRTGNAPATLKVTVKIVHPYRGDIALHLIAPDGTSYLLKPAQISDLADNIDTQYTIDASTEPANGTWQLRAHDTYGFDTGHIDHWNLTF